MMIRVGSRKETGKVRVSRRPSTAFPPLKTAKFQRLKYGPLGRHVV